MSDLIPEAVRSRARAALWGLVADGGRVSSIPRPKDPLATELWPSASGPEPSTALALLLADTLITAGASGYDPLQVAQRYLEWLLHHASSPEGSGSTPLHGMDAGDGAGENAVAPALFAPRQRNWTGGLLLRPAVMGIWGWRLSESQLAWTAMADTRLTHPHPICQEASAAYAVAIASAVRDGASGAVAWQSALDWHRRAGHEPDVRASLEAAIKRAPQDSDAAVLSDLQNAFYQAVHAPTAAGGRPGVGNARWDGPALALIGATCGVDALQSAWLGPTPRCQREDTPSHLPSERRWSEHVEQLADDLLATPLFARSPRTAASPSLRDRFRGALLGGALGDALGFPYETRPVDYQLRRPLAFVGHRPGGISDDTQLTLLIGHCLIQRGWLDPDELSHQLVAWLPHGIGKGRATIDAVHRLESQPWWSAGLPSAGNGAAMRVAPIALLRLHDPILRQAEVLLSALPTHHDALAAASAVVMAEGVAWLLELSPLEFAPAPFIAHVTRGLDLLAPDPYAERRDPSCHTLLADRLRLVERLVGRPLPRPLASFTVAPMFWKPCRPPSGASSLPPGIQEKFSGWPSTSATMPTRWRRSPAP